VAVHKVEVRVVVLAEADTAQQAAREVEALSLSQLGRELEDGAYVGSVAVASATTVPPDRVPAELLAVGNDGTFFECSQPGAEDGSPQLHQLLEEEMDEAVYEEALRRVMGRLNSAESEDQQEDVIRLAEAEAGAVNNAGRPAQLAYLGGGAWPPEGE